jgi:hypothetical protein
MIDHLHRLGLIDENWRDKSFNISLEDMERTRNRSENTLQPLPTIRTDEGCGPDDFRQARSNVKASRLKSSGDAEMVIPAGYFVEVPSICDSDQLLAECLASAELTPEKRASLILRALHSVRRESRDEAFEETLQSHAINSKTPSNTDMDSPSADSYFKPKRDDESIELREIVLRLERQQQLMQHQVRQMAHLQNQVQQMQNWHPSFGRSLNDLESSLSRTQVNNAINSANAFRLPEYSRPMAQTPQPLEPIYNPYARNDDSEQQFRGVNDEVRQLSRAVDQINQRISQLMQEQGVSEARYLGVPKDEGVWSSNPAPLLPR